MLGLAQYKTQLIACQMLFRRARRNVKYTEFICGENLGSRHLLATRIEFLHVVSIRQYHCEIYKLK